MSRLWRFFLIIALIGLWGTACQKEEKAAPQEQTKQAEKAGEAEEAEEAGEAEEAEEAGETEEAEEEVTGAPATQPKGEEEPESH